MSPADLAAHDVADRRRVIAAALAEERRGRALRVERHACSVAAFDRNIARLEARLAALDATVPA